MSWFPLLLNPSSSPTRIRLENEFRKKFPGALWVELGETGYENLIEAAQRVAPGVGGVVYDLSEVDFVLSVGADFVENEKGARTLYNQFFSNRTSGESKSLYIVESGLSATGQIAEERFELAEDQMLGFLSSVALNLELGVERDAVQPILEPFAKLLDPDVLLFSEYVTTRLQTSNRRSLVFVGQDLPPVPHAVGLLINEKLGNLGRSVRFVQETEKGFPEFDRLGVEELKDAVDSRKIQTMIFACSDTGLGDGTNQPIESLLSEIPEVFGMAYYSHELSGNVDYSILKSNALESWSDGLAYDGRVVIQKPIVPKAFESMSDIELLARLLGKRYTSGKELVLETFGRDDTIFERALENGFIGVSHKFNRSLVSGARLADWSKEVLASPEEKVKRRRLDSKNPSAGWTREKEIELLRLECKVGFAMRPKDSHASYIPILEKLIENDPSDGESLLLLAKYYAALLTDPDSSRADFYYQRTTTLTDWEIQALISWARSFVDREEFGSAIRLLEEAYEKEPQNYIYHYLESVRKKQSKKFGF